MANYYIRNPYTGESATREFVERFITNWASPDECERSYYDSIYGITFGGMQDTYAVDSKRHQSSTDNYGESLQTIGRASQTSNGKNANEILWCLKVDISNACKRLNKQQREVLTYRYIYDYSDQHIAELLGVYKQLVSRLVSRAFDALAKYLDNGII